MCRKWRNNSTVENEEQSFTFQKKCRKALLHNRHLRKVSFTAEAREMFLLRQKWRISLVCNVVPQTLDSMFAQKLAAAGQVLEDHLARASDLTSFLEKTQTRSCLITSKHVSRVEEVKIPPSTLPNHFRLLQRLFKGAHYPFGHMGSTSTTSKHVQHLLSLPLPVP